MRSVLLAILGSASAILFLLANSQKGPFSWISIRSYQVLFAYGHTSSFGQDWPGLIASVTQTISATHELWLLPRHLAVPLSALLFQFVPPIFFLVISAASYGAERHISTRSERLLSLGALGLAALVSLLLRMLGVYSLLLRARPRNAAIMIATCCMPALLGGAIYLYTLLVFLMVV